MNFDAYEEQRAEEYYADFMRAPDWLLVAQEADQERVAEILRSLHEGAWSEAAVAAERLLRQVAEEHADMLAAAERNELETDALVKRGFIANRG